MADDVGGGLHNGGAGHVGNANWHNMLADDGGLHAVSMGLVGRVGEVSSETVTLDDGRVMGRSSESNGGGDQLGRCTDGKGQHHHELQQDITSVPH